MRVAVVGASPKVDRYSNQAIRLLLEHNHEVIPVTPGHSEIEALPVVASIEELAPGSIDIVTLYVNESRSTAIINALITLAPRRVIMNPGAENPKLLKELVKANIDVEFACTLVLLHSHQFK